MSLHLKKTVIAIAIILSTGSYASAGAGIAGFSTIFQQLLDQFVQLSTQSSVYLNTAANVSIQAKEIFLKPMIDSLLAGSLSQGAADISTFIQGGMDGAAPLFVTNTKSYLDNIEKIQYQKTISDISGASGVYKDSILGALVDNYRAKGDPISALTESNLPAIIKSNACNEGSLIKRTQNDIASGYTKDGLSGEALYQAHKQELSNAFGCQSAIITSSRAKTLVAANAQDPSLSGLAGFYNITVNGDNAWSKTLAATQVASQKAEESRKAAEGKVNQNGGYIAQSVFEKLLFDENGDPYPSGDAPDDPDTEQVITPAGSVESLAANAADTGRQVALNAIGSGDLLNGLLARLGSLLQGGMFSLVGGGGLSNLSVTQPKVSDTRPDLSEEAHARLVVTLNKQLVSHKASLQRLIAGGEREKTILLPYKDALDQLKACYDRANPVAYYADQKADMTKLNNFLNDRYFKINGRLNAISKEYNDGNRGLGIIDSVYRDINNSRNSREIQNISETRYQNPLDNGQIPDMGSATIREGDYDAANGAIEADKMGEYKDNQTNCNKVLNSGTINTSPSTIQNTVQTCTNGANNPYGPEGSRCNTCSPPDTWDANARKCNAPQESQVF